MELFVSRPELSFDPLQKVASVQMDENPDNWGREVLVELHRTLPSTANYTPHVSFVRIDREQGIGFGTIVLSASTDTALAAARPGASPAQCVVPIVIRSHVMAPLDILMLKSGKMCPLSEVRLREALFRPDTFEMVTDDWGDTSLYSLFYPPSRDGMDGAGGLGGASGQTVFGGQGKFAELLTEISPTMLQADIAKVSHTLEHEPGLLEKAASNEAYTVGLQAIVLAETPDSGANLVKTAMDSLDVDVAQFGWDEEANTYWMKTASREHFLLSDRTDLDRGQLLKLAGEDLVQGVDAHGVVTLSDPSSTNLISGDDSRWSVIDKTGIYRVSDGAREMTGWVITSILDGEGNHSPLAVFTNGSEGCVQSQIAGVMVAGGSDLPSGTPQGTGLFYCAGKGGVVATEPLLVEGSSGSTDGHTTWLCRNLEGDTVKVDEVAGLPAISAQNNHYFVPAGIHFLPLDSEKSVTLIENPNEKVASGATARVWGGEHEVYIEWEGAPKLASAVPRALSHDDARFVLCAAGLPIKLATQVVADGSTGFSNTVRVSDVGGLFADMKVAAFAEGAKISSACRALRQDLVKEAAMLPETQPIDAVLSLGFINSENIRLFASRRPYLEKALHSVCELLLASRMGLNEIPEAAASRCARGLDDVIQGLRALMFREEDGT